MDQNQTEEHEIVVRLRKEQILSLHHLLQEGLRSVLKIEDSEANKLLAESTVRAVIGRLLEVK